MVNNIKKKESLEDKWGDGCMQLGWTAIPTALLHIQSDLSLSPLGLNIILNLVSHWWVKSDKPYPSQESLSKRMGVSKRSIQREINKLVLAGLIKKEANSVSDKKFKGRNSYDLSKLIDKMNTLATLKFKVSV